MFKKLVEDKLPEFCMAYHPTDKKPILIHRGEEGYWPYEHHNPKQWNELQGITPAQVNAMLNGSAFGWDAPIADPDCPANSITDPYDISV